MTRAAARSGQSRDFCGKAEARAADGSGRGGFHRAQAARSRRSGRQEGGLPNAVARGRQACGVKAGRAVQRSRARRGGSARASADYARGPGRAQGSCDAPLIRKISPGIAEGRPAVEARSGRPRAFFRRDRSDPRHVRRLTRGRRACM